MSVLYSLKNNTVFVILFAVFGLSPDQELQSQVAPGQDIKKIRNIIEAISESEALLAKYPDSDFAPNIMFQLVELYAQRAKLRFQREMMIYEEAEKKFDQGILTDEPTMPQIDYSDAVRTSDMLLEKYANVSFRDKLLYRIALCQIEEGNEEKSFDYFVMLSLETQDKQLLEESYFRIGEYFFKHKNYQKAVDHYSHLLSSWDCPFFDMALYKLAWSYYNLEEYTKAIGTFIYLIEDVSLLLQTETSYLGTTKADLRQESKEYVAICFTEYGGTEKAREFLSDKKEQQYTEDILLLMAEVYKKRNFYTDAISCLNILIEFYPDKPEAVNYQQQIVENYELAGDNEKYTEARLFYISNYGLDSVWLRTIKDDDIRHQVLNIAEGYLFALSSEAQAIAQVSKTKSHYDLAINRYRTFYRNFPNSHRIGKVLFYLAECLYEIESYIEAADFYYEIVFNYTESEFRETAAYNRVLAYDKLIKLESGTDSTSCYLQNFLGLGAARVDTFIVFNAHQSQFLQASNDFVLFFTQSSRLPELLMKYALTLYELEQFKLAKDTYEHMISNLSINSYLPQAYTMIGQCAFKLGDFLEAEVWFQRLTDIFPDSTRYVERAKRMIASTKFKLAESYLESSDSTRAALEFEKLGWVVYDSTISERALFEAALLYENLGEKNKAIETYESIPEIFPETKSIDKAIFKAGVLCEELEDWNRAAINYLALSEIVPNSPLAPKSLYFAAKCYENFDKFDDARLCYDKYTKLYYDDAERYLEAAFRKGEIVYNQNDFQTALNDFDFVVNSYQKFVAENKEVEKYIPANAQFLKAEILYFNFQNIKLEPPLKRNLKQKRQKFEQVIKAFAEAAKYKIADWTTASTHKIGTTFEEFANALIESPRPENLTGKALEEYNAKLWESVLPFKEKALSTYQANVKQALENDINNKWIDESKKRIKAIAEELERESNNEAFKTG